MYIINNRKQAVYNAMISGFSASIVQLYILSLEPGSIDIPLIFDMV